MPRTGLTAELEAVDQRIQSLDRLLELLALRRIAPAGDHQVLEGGEPNHLRIAAGRDEGAHLFAEIVGHSLASLAAQAPTNCASRSAERASISACRLLPWASIVTTAGKSFDLDDPHRLGDAEVELVDAQDARHGLGDQRRRTADGVQVNPRGFAAGGECLRPHAALADDGTHLEVPHDVSLIRLLADARRRAGRQEAVVLGVEPADDGPTVIDGAAGQQRADGLLDLQVIAGGEAGLLDEGVDHPLVRGVAAGQHDPGEQHRVAHPQPSDVVG